MSHFVTFKDTPIDESFDPLKNQPTIGQWQELTPEEQKFVCQVFPTNNNEVLTTPVLLLYLGLEWIHQLPQIDEDPTKPQPIFDHLWFLTKMKIREEMVLLNESPPNLDLV